MKLYGDYHIHSEFSRDAKGTVDDIVRTAKERGLVEVAITDHGWYTRSGVHPKHYKQIRAMIERAKKEHEIDVYFGIESNVRGTNGQIDALDDYRRDFDLVLCGIHTGTRPANIKSFFSFFLPNYFWAIFRKFPAGRVRKNTEVMKRIIERNDIDIWVHPNRYFKLDLVEVAKTCVERGTLIELNGKRISFRPIDFERMLAIGAKFIINSDSHSPEHVGRTNVATEFLKKVEYKDTDIINLSGRFRRGEANLLAKAAATEEKLEQKTRKETRTERKTEKKQVKAKLKREKVIKRKGD